MGKYLDYAAYSEDEEEESVTEEEKSSENEPQNFEDILEQIGGFGRFQVIILIFILFYEIPSGFLAFVPVFLGSTPSEWKCLTAEQTLSMSSKEICSCNGTKFAAHYSIVSEWNLICDASWVVDSITSFQMFGMFFGNIIPPQISDWYGRKITFLLLMTIMVVGQCGSALATDPYSFAIARFICGIGLAGYFSLNGIFAMEFLTPKWRQLGGCLGPLGEGVVILGILAYFIKPWRLLLWATTIPFVTVIFVFPFLPESPRWLLRNQRISEAEGVLRYMARVNRKKPPGLECLKKISEQENAAGGGGGQQRYSYLDLFRRKEVRGKTLIFIGIWFCWAFTYFGLSFNIRNFGVDPYLMTVLMGTSDCIGFRAALLVNNRLGRRKALVVFAGVSALFFLFVASLQVSLEDASLKKYKGVLIVCILLGKICVAGSRSSIRVLTVESYPVSIRTMGFGVSRVSASFGGIAAPQIAFVGTRYPAIPPLAFGILGFLGSLLSLLLTETNGKPLQDRMTSEPGKGQVVPTISDRVKNNNNNNKGSRKVNMKSSYGDDNGNKYNKKVKRVELHRDFRSKSF